MTRRFTLALSALLSAALFLTACSGGENTADDEPPSSPTAGSSRPGTDPQSPATPTPSASPTGTPARTPATTPAPSATPSGDQLPDTFSWTVSRKAGEAHDGGGRPLLEAVRVGRHETFHRVVFEFSSGTPEFYAEYTRTLRQGGSGRKIEVDGEHILLLVFRGQSPESHFDSTPTTSVVEDVVTASIFEGDMRIGIGLDTSGAGRPGFRVSTFGDRVVLDFAHTSATG